MATAIVSTTSEHRRGQLSRRRILTWGMATGVALAAARTGGWASPAVTHAQPAPPPAGPPLPVSGQPAPELADFDQVMLSNMARWGLTGGALALAKDGRMVFSHAYGFADRETGQPFLPSSLCRIASDSKPFTAVAILRLIDAGKLRLEDKAFPILAGLQPPANSSRDPRLDEITIQQLLQHTGGWDSAKSYDPQYPPYNQWEASTLGVVSPPSAEQIVRFMISQPLDFDPGTKYAYSNFGYNVLGRVIERISGLPYGDYVQQEVIAPSGISGMRLGRTRLEDRFPGEVRYVNLAGQALVPSVFPGVGYVPNAYGGYYMEALDAHGGWIATAEDQLRLATAVDGQRGQALLRPETVDAMLHMPLPQDTAASGAGNDPSASGLCWIVQKEGNGLSWSHAGALEGACASWIIRRADGSSISFVFNSLPTDYAAFFPALGGALVQAVDAVQSWPSVDLF